MVTLTKQLYFIWIPFVNVIYICMYALTKNGSALGKKWLFIFAPPMVAGGAFLVSSFIFYKIPQMTNMSFERPSMLVIYIHTIVVCLSLIGFQKLNGVPFKQGSENKSDVKEEKHNK